MNKNTLITLICVAAVLVAGIVAGVVFLYRDGGSTSASPKINAAEQLPLLQAVPSDAAAVFCAGSLKDGAALMLDDTKAFRALVYDSRSDAAGSFFKAVADGLDGGELSSLKSMPMAVSLHYSGSLVPLVAIGAPREANDSTAQVVTLRSAAQEAGLASGFYGSDDLSVVLVSSSETLVSSSLRHLKEGLSIMSNKDFVSCLQGVESKSVLFLSHSYASKLLPAFFLKPVTRHSDFIKDIASWTAVSLMSWDDSSLSAKGSFSAGRNEDAFYKVFEDQPLETPSFSKVVPSGTVFAVTLPIYDQAGYLASYGKYLDARTRLASRQNRLTALKRSTGVGPEDWSKALSIKEVARAQWRTGDETHEAVFTRVGRKDYSLIFKGLEGVDDKTYTMSARPYAFAGFASALFGSLFSLPDESAFAYTGEWLVSGSPSDVEDYISRYSEGDVLRSLLADASLAAPSLTRDCSFAAYFSAGACRAESLFSPAMLQPVNSTLNGAAYEPCILAVSKDEFSFDVFRVPFLSKSSVPAVVSDAVVEVPSGPFEVKNSGTGRTNLLAQQDNYYLSLKETDGKGVWSVPFTGPLCGRVENIDYYANGKIQWLFASGSSLYLLDRLGRFVSGFPVDIGKEILLGPAAYDFSGAKGYSVMVLHTDNTVGMYNIHGVKPAGWQGIATDEKIIALPELFKLGGKSFWAVRTAVQTRIYPFDGGDPVYAQDGAKSIRRDSVIEIEDNSIKVTCNDGKSRNIKL